MDDQNRNLILATALSFAVILAWFVLFPPPPAEEPAPQTAPQTAQDGTVTVPAADGTTAGQTPGLAVPAAVSRDAALAKTDRVRIETERLSGSLSLTGGRIDDLHLTDYFVTLKKDSPTVTLFNPAGTARAYYALYGWAPAGGLDFEAVPVRKPNGRSKAATPSPTTLPSPWSGTTARG